MHGRPEFEVFSHDHFGLQSWVLRRLPPLSNDRVFQWSVGLLVAEGLCALGSIFRLPSTICMGLAVLALAMLASAHAVVLLLTFAGDALPAEYGRLINVRERLHPITMAGLAYLVLSHVTAFATGYATLQRLDLHTWLDHTQHSYLTLWVFSYLVTFTIAFGDIQPSSVAVKLLLVLQVAASATMLFGMVAVIVSSYVGGLTSRRELLTNLRSRPRETPAGGDQAAGWQDDIPGQERPEIIEPGASQEATPQILSGNPQSRIVQHTLDGTVVELSKEERPPFSDEPKDVGPGAGHRDLGE
jgi:hypothetical protein